MAYNNVEEGEVLRATPINQHNPNYGREFIFEVGPYHHGLSGPDVPSYVRGWHRGYKDWYGCRAERLI